MKKLRLPLLALMLPVALISCLGKSKDGKDLGDIVSSSSKYFDSIRTADSLAKYGPPVAIDFSKVLDEANNGKRVTIEGYLALPSSSMISDESVQLALFERAGQFHSSLSFILDMPVGSGKNTMKKIPLKYAKSDVDVTGNKEEKIVIGDHVKVTGKFTVYGTFCSMDIQEIEKLEPAAIDYASLGATKITSANAEDTTLEDKLVYLEGTIEIPTLTMGGDYTFIYLKVPGMSDQVTVDVGYGSIPGRMQAPPENYTDSDIKIFGDNGNPINIKKKVRVYGVKSGSSIYAESINNL